MSGEAWKSVNSWQCEGLLPSKETETTEEVLPLKTVSVPRENQWETYETENRFLFAEKTT